MLTPIQTILSIFDYLPSVVTGDVVTFKTKYAGQTCDLARKEIMTNGLSLKAELVSVNEFKVYVL